MPLSDAMSQGIGVPAGFIWVYIVCFIISAALFISTVCILARKVIARSRYSSADAESNMLTVICLLVVACLIGSLPLGIHEALQNTDNVLSAVLLGVPFGMYDCLNILLLEGRLDTFYNLLLSIGGSYSGFACVYLFYITCLYVIAPIAIAATAISMFRGRVSLMRAKSLAKKQADWGRVYVFEGVNDRSLSFVRDVKRKTAKESAYKAPLVIFAGVNREDAERRSGEIRDLSCKNIRFIDASAETLLAEVFASLKGRPFKSLHVFFFGDDQGSDLGLTLNFLRNLAGWTSLLCRSAERDPFSESQLADIDENILAGHVGARRLRFTDQGIPRYHVYCACSGRSDEPALDSMKGISGIDVRIVDEGREAVFDLLWNHPLHKNLPPHYLLEEQDELHYKKADLVVVVLGAGEYGFEAFRALCWLGQIVDVELSLFVIDQMTREEFEDKVDYWCPDLRNSDCFSSPGIRSDGEGGRRQTLMYYQATVGKRDFNETLQEIHRQIVSISKESVKKGLGKVSPYCIVSLGDDNLNTDAAISMRQVFCGDGEDAGGLLEPSVFVNIFDYSRHAVIRKMNGSKLPMSLQPFGSFERIFTEGYIVDSPLESLAFAVHSAFEESRDGESAVQKQVRSYLDYTSWQMNRLSSEANALAIRTKLWALGLDMEMGKKNGHCERSGQGLLEDAIGRLFAPFADAMSSGDAEWQADFFASDHQLARMTRAEHDRWVALYMTEGWTGMSPKASLHYLFRGMNDGRHDSHLLMRNPFIAPFDQLGEISKRVGREDARLNDIRAITGLELVMGDSIGYGEERYAISIVPDSDPGLFVVDSVLQDKGGVYEKKPGTTGFFAFATDEPGFMFHNVLEDGTQESPGVFICGTMGEIWRIEKLPDGKTLGQLAGDYYPEKLNERYVLDDEGADDGRNIRFDDLAHLPVPKGWQESGAFENAQDALRSYTSWVYDFDGCRKIRYRKPGDEKPKSFDGVEKEYPETQFILAAQTDCGWNERCIQGSYTEYWVNREKNVWGQELDHGGGDWIVCGLVDCSGRDIPQGVPRWETIDASGLVRTFCPETFIGKGEAYKKARPYVINGNVFERTYQRADEVRLASDCRDDGFGSLGREGVLSAVTAFNR
ncbi:MAG: hypothetical protein IJI68_11630 [Eggerthellaceae bacterium]|nr:hypothetical protein [Eggerthellaceae bacterium]